MTPSSQEMEPPTKPERFTPGTPDQDHAERPRPDAQPSVRTILPRLLSSIPLTLRALESPVPERECGQHQ